MQTSPPIAPARRRLWEFAGPAAVTLVAALLRFVGLWHPHAFVFDETYYVKDAWSLLHLGFEGKWPDDANARFLAGDTMIFTSDPSFVVHPPLGKWFIAFGMAVFGADSGFGWRFATALVGTLTVLLLIVVARKMTGSLAWSLVAGGLFALDGLGIVLSRVALLDGFLTFFVLLAFWFLLLDRDRTAGRLPEWFEHAGDQTVWGPVLWRRPWVIAAGLALGAACAVKWSAIWVIAAFGIWLVVTDAFARRRAGVIAWPASAALRQGPVAFALLVPPALIAYLVSWSGWFATSGGYDRQSDPNPLVALWNFHKAAYGFHVGLTTGHSYASPAWQWPLLMRPTAMYWNLRGEGVEGCTMPSGCAEAITSIPNPLTWYAGMVAIVLIIVAYIMRVRHGAFRDGRISLLLTALAALYLPWLAFPERTIFQFYTVALMPFVVLTLVIGLRFIAQPDSLAPGLVVEREADAEGVVPGRRARLWVVIGILIAIALVAAFWLPLWTGIPVPYEFWRWHTPITTWV